MKKPLLVLAFFGAVAAVLAQSGAPRIDTCPKLPSREALGRLDLAVAWAARVKLDGHRDGFYSFQLIPGKSFTLLIAQTLQGAVVAINADTGDTLWRTTVGLPYRSVLPVGYNEQAIFALRHETLFVLDRDTGKQLLYTTDPESRQPVYGMQLESLSVTAPVADGKWLFVCFGNRMVRYAVPNFRAPAPAAEGTAEGGKRTDSPQLERQWTFETLGIISQPPVINREFVVVTTDGGTVLVVKKSVPGDEAPEQSAEFKTDGPVVARPAAYRSMVYIPCQDYFLYAYDTAQAKSTWRFAAQSAINSAPKATDTDLFVPVSNGGLYRVDRVTGKARWLNKESVKFLANNNQFTYGRDRVGNMLILDYERGTTMAVWDVRDWTLSIANDLTDRIYLASHDGQIMCLRHRDLVRPLRITTFEEPPAKAKAKEEKKKSDDAAPPGDGK